jgi:hypothetical protein
MLAVAQRRQRPGNLRKFAISVVAVSAGLGTSPAAAANLSWQAGEACPTQADVRFAVERMLGMPLERAKPARLVVMVSRDTDSRFVATVRISEPSLVPMPAAAAERTLVEDDCWTLAAAVEAVVVLAIGVEEPTARVNPSPLSPLSRRKGVDTGYAGSQANPHAVAAPPPAGPDTAPDEKHSGSLRAREEARSFGISGWLVGNSGALPEPELGLGIALAHRFEAFEVRASVEFFPSQAVSTTASEVELTGELDALTLSALVCMEPWDLRRTAGAVGVSLCTGWAIARWSGAAISAASSWWTGPRAEVGVAWPFPELDVVRVGLRVGGLLPLTRPGVYLESDQGAGLAYRLPTVVGSILAGFEVVLP